MILKYLKLILVALIGCVTLTACPGSGDDDDPLEEIRDVPSIEDIHNEPSNNPAYSKERL